MIKQILYIFLTAGLMFGQTSAMAQGLNGVKKVNVVRKEVSTYPGTRDTDKSIRAKIYQLASDEDVDELKKITKRRSIDLTDHAGNTALCESVWRINVPAFYTLKSLRANENHPCMLSINNAQRMKFNEAAAAYERDKGAAAGWSTGTKWAVGIGALALIGGGIAIAAGGGGGGGDKNPDCRSYTLADCPTGGDCAQCTSGGTTTYKLTGCQDGYTQSGNTCTANACTGYTLNACPENGSCGECKSGETTKYKLNGCANGYIPSGNICVTDCTSYTLADCPTGGDCAQCTSGGTTTYKLTGCVSGYTQSGDTCTANACTGYTLNACPENGNCGECKSGETTKYKLDGCNSGYELVDGTKCSPITCDGPNEVLVGSECKCKSGYERLNGVCIDTSTPGKPPLDDDPTTHETAEYHKGNFLDQIKASAAYARGYTGKIVNRDADGSLAIKDNSLISEEKVKVGIIDSYLDVTHPDLEENIAHRTLESGQYSTFGYNFNYGPCRNGDTTNCIAFQPLETNTTTGSIIFYDGNGNITNLYKDQQTLSEYTYWANNTTTGYASDYDWDDPNKKYDVRPKDSGAVDSDTNTRTSDHGTHVAGIIGTTKNDTGMHGVAPNVEMTFAQFYNSLDNGYHMYKAFEAFKNDGIRVVNMSLGYNVESNNNTVNAITNTTSAYDFMEDYWVDGHKIAAQNNIAIVKAAGNDGNNYAADLSSGLPLTKEFAAGTPYDLTNLFVVVVSVDKNNTLASYSQTCGKASNFCIATPGGDLNRGADAFLNSELYLTRKAEADAVEATYEAAANTFLAHQEDYKNGKITEDQYNAYYDEYSAAYDVYETEMTEFINWANTAMIEEAQNWGIYSTVNSADNLHAEDSKGNAYGYMQGTSMATPVVTGSIALLMGAYPHLTTQQVVKILFDTATDLGTTGVDTTFGHGLVNLDAATSPIGYLSFNLSGVGTNTPQSETPSNTTSNSQLTISKTLLNKMATVLPQNITAFDAYDRGFEVPVSSLFGDTTHQKRRLFKNDFRAFMNPTRQQVAKTGLVSFAFNAPVSYDGNTDIPYGYLQMNYQPTKNTTLSAYYTENTLFNGDNYFQQSLNNPFINMNTAYGFDIAHQFTNDNQYKLSFVSGRNAFFEDEDNDDLYDNSMFSLNAELSHKLTDKAQIGIVGGLLREDESVLGMLGTDAFAFESADTYFGGLKLKYQLMDKLSLAGAYYRGYTNPNLNSSLLRFSDIESESIAFNLTYQSNPNKSMGIDVYSPLRIVAGSMNMTMPTGRHPTEDIVYYDSYQASIKDAAREWTFSLFHNNKVSDSLNFQTRFGLRLNPDHVRNARPDYFGLFNLNLKY